MFSRRARLAHMLDVLDARLRPIEDTLIALQEESERRAVQDEKIGKMLADIQRVVIANNREINEYQDHNRDQFDRLGESFKHLKQAVAQIRAAVGSNGSALS